MARETRPSMTIKLAYVCGEDDSSYFFSMYLSLGAICLRKHDCDLLTRRIPGCFYDGGEERGWDKTWRLVSAASNKGTDCSLFCPSIVPQRWNW
uniref:Uncharacterized protein n=1 Tax=Bionectria ochroleuca TaxID=29856 RepID=A0A0B7JQ10_BIOOC